MNSFQRVYEAARTRHSDEWSTLAPTRIAEMIYNEMRRLDAEAVRAAKERWRIHLPLARTVTEGLLSSVCPEHPLPVALRFPLTGRYLCPDPGFQVALDAADLNMGTTAQ